MSYISLARKYRPQRFRDLIGQELVVASLRGGIKRNIVPHSMVFSGPRGTGKTTTCRILAKAINCHNLDDQSEPCLECESCKALIQGSVGGYFEVDGASYNGVDMVRELISGFGFLPPAPFKNKLYVIDEAHMLSNAAFNAMLKSIEEPPPHVYIALVTTEPHKIPDTILSRCVHFELQPASTSALQQHLRVLADREGLLVDDWVLSEICKRARNSVRDALTLLDRYWLLKISGEDSLVREWLAAARDSRYVDLLSSILNNDSETSIKLFRSLCAESNDVDSVIKRVCEVMSEFVVYFATPKPEPDEVFEKLKAIYKNLSVYELMDITTDTLRYGDLALKSVFRKLVFEAGLVKLCHRPNQSTVTNDSLAGKPAVYEKTSEHRITQKTAPDDQAKVVTVSQQDSYVSSGAQGVPMTDKPLNQSDYEPKSKENSGSEHSENTRTQRAQNRKKTSESVEVAVHSSVDQVSQVEDRQSGLPESGKPLDADRFIQRLLSDSKLGAFQKNLKFEISATSSDIFLNVAGGRIAIEAAKKEEKTLKSALKEAWPNFTNYHVIYTKSDQRDSKKKMTSPPEASSEIPVANKVEASSIEEEFEQKMRLVSEMLSNSK